MSHTKPFLELVDTISKAQRRQRIPVSGANADDISRAMVTISLVMSNALETIKLIAEPVNENIHGRQADFAMLRALVEDAVGDFVGPWREAIDRMGE